MLTPAEVTEELVEAVHRSASGSRPEQLKQALMAVLAELDVREGDPAWTDGRDVIGAAYERLLTGDVRRPLGQFFTPLPVGRVMARWALDERPALLVEPGCGSGSLLIAASHERAPSTQLLGLDVDPLAISMAAANRSIRRLARLELRELDFLLDELDERPDAILCNPPYTRHHAIAPEQKAAIHEGLARRLGTRFSHLASLHVLFLIRALEVTADEARIAFITPAHWLDMRYAREVKKLLLEQAHVEAIITFPSDQPVFEHALTTAAITLIRKGADGRAATRIVRAASSDAAELGAQIADPKSGQRIELISARKWSRAARTAEPPHRPLSDFARVRRGAATGHNGFFVVSEARRRELRLDRGSVRPCLASPRYFAGPDVDMRVLAALPDSVPRWLVYPKRPRARGPLADYLAYGETLGVRQRRLVIQRDRAGRRWYQVEASFAAPILFTYFNRRTARFIRNRAAAVPLNTWLVIEPFPEVDPDDLFAILTGAEIRESLQEDCRIYGNGLWKLEPSELANLALPRAPRRRREVS